MPVRVQHLAAATLLAVTSAQHARRLGIESGYVRTPDGIRLYYERAGHGPVVIAPFRLYLFERFKQLADSYTVISYDMRDRGLSDPVSDTTRLTIQDDVRDLEAVRAHFHVDRFSAIGWSYLGLMVVMYAIDHPSRVERIVQLGPVPPRFGARYSRELTAGDEDSVPDPAGLARLERLRHEGYDRRQPREYCVQEWAVNRFQLVGNPADVDRLGVGPCALRNEWPVNLERHFKYAIASVARLRISSEELAKVTVPVLTVHGTKDRNAPYGGGREWAGVLTDARLLTIQGAAHAAFVEHPEIVFPAVRAFLAGGWPAQAERITSAARRD